LASNSSTSFAIPWFLKHKVESAHESRGWCVAIRQRHLIYLVGISYTVPDHNDIWPSWGLEPASGLPSWIRRFKIFQYTCNLSSMPLKRSVRNRFDSEPRSIKSLQTYYFCLKWSTYAIKTQFAVFSIFFRLQSEPEWRGMTLNFSKHRSYLRPMNQSNLINCTSFHVIDVVWFGVAHPWADTRNHTGFLLNVSFRLPHSSNKPKPAFSFLIDAFRGVNPPQDDAGCVNNSHFGSIDSESIRFPIFDYFRRTFLNFFLVSRPQNIVRKWPPVCSRPSQEPRFVNFFLPPGVFSTD
jgi:hypothetical protein